MQVEERKNRIKEIEAKLADFQRELQLIDKDLTVELGTRGRVFGILNPVVKYQGVEALEGLKIYDFEQPIISLEFTRISVGEADSYIKSIAALERFMQANQPYWGEY